MGYYSINISFNLLNTSSVYQCSNVIATTGQQSGTPTHGCITDVDSGDVVCSGPCMPGTYCEEGSIEPKLCPENYYCPNGLLFFLSDMVSITSHCSPPSVAIISCCNIAPSQVDGGVA